MIFTQNNENNRKFDSTRTFSGEEKKPAPVRKTAAAPANGQSPRPAPQSHAVKKPTPQGKPAEAGSASANSQKSVQRPLQDLAQRAQRSPARTAQDNAATAQIKKPAPAPKPQQKPQTRAEEEKEEKRGISEGTNTVLSVIKAIVYIMFVFVVSAFLAVAAITVGNDVFAFVKSEDVVEITLPEEPDIDDVADVLYGADIIKYPSVFKLYAKFEGLDENFVGGTYSVSPMMNYENLLLEFMPKPVVGTVTITIPEGYTTDEIIDLFVEKGIGTREGFVDVIQNGEFNYWFVNALEESGAADNEDRIYRLDGYLFPDTYQFYKSSSEWTAINKLLKRFGQIFKKEYREQCEAMGYTVDEMVTLASLIEKEAANSSEFFLVSSVFHNRLNNKAYYPRLESDATVVYAIQHETGKREVDLTYETPYNTYKYNGLTPGAIANPSASAILAALMPKESNYFFFISNNGKTYFSETKAQHDAYIAQFRAEAAQ